MTTITKSIEPLINILVIKAIYISRRHEEKSLIETTPNKDKGS